MSRLPPFPTDCRLIPEFRVATHIVERACRVAEAIQKKGSFWKAEKQDGSQVTVADYTSQALLGRSLQTHFPRDPFIAEENTDVLSQLKDGIGAVTRSVRHFVRGAKPDDILSWIAHGHGQAGTRFWLSDPLDVTSGFIHHQQYAINLALCENGVIQLAVMGCPHLTLKKGEEKSRGQLFVAVRGQGSWHRPLDQDSDYVRLAVSGRKDPEKARALRSLIPMGDDYSQGDIQLVERTHHEFGSGRRPIKASCPIRYAYLALGLGEYMYNFSLSHSTLEATWDHVPELFVEEAGGRVSDLNDRPLDFGAGRSLLNHQGIFASNGHLHDHGLRAYRVALHTL